jgi:hypothetical protein
MYLSLFSIHTKQLKIKCILLKQEINEKLCYQIYSFFPSTNMSFPFLNHIIPLLHIFFVFLIEYKNRKTTFHFLLNPTLKGTKSSHLMDATDIKFKPIKE